MNAVDTNVLLYVHDPRDSVKQRTAKALLRAVAPGALIWQVACEYLWNSRKLEPFGHSFEKAWQDTTELRGLWTPILPTWEALDKADELRGRLSLSFWDAILISVCIVGGVKRLYSEDFDAYPRIDGLEIINPFRKP